MVGFVGLAGISAVCALAFGAGVRYAVDIEAIRADLDAVNRAVQPTQVSVWIKPHARG